MLPIFTFRPITRQDIPLLHRWRNLPHVSQWWDPPKLSLADATREYTAYMRPDFGVDAFMVGVKNVDEIESVEFAYVQEWQTREFPYLKPFVALSEATLGVDVFIGEPDMLHRGFGTLLLRQFIEQHVFSDPTVPDCIIDPLPDNTAAIRSYEKVGFVHEKTFTGSDGKPVYFMRLRRPGSPSP